MMNTILRGSNGIKRMNKLINNLNFNITKSHVFKNAFRQNFTKFSFCNKLFFTQKKLFTEKIKLKELKELIQIVNSDEINDQKEDWGEIIALNLEKENYMKFYDHLKYVKEKNIVLSLQDINKIMSMVYNKNIKAVDTIYNYICDKNIHLDSISYFYLISSHLQFKNFISAFDFFDQASLLNIPMNLSIIVSLYKELIFLPNEEDKLKFQNIMEAHIKKFYPDDVMELLEGLTADLAKKEGLENLTESDVKGNSRGKKSKKSKISDKAIKRQSEKNFNKSSKDEEVNINKEEEISVNIEIESKGLPLESENKETEGQICNGENTSAGLENFQQNINSTANLDKTTIDEKDNTVSITESANPPPQTSSSSSKKSVQNKKSKKSKKSSSDTGLENLFGSNRGIIVITQSFMDEESDDDGSQSD